jgi:hypothetical protein
MMIGWMMNVEQLVEWKLTNETEVPGEKPTQCHFVRHKSHITWDRTSATYVRSRQLTAWARARAPTQKAATIKKAGREYNRKEGKLYTVGCLRQTINIAYNVNASCDVTSCHLYALWNPNLHSQHTEIPKQTHYAVTDRTVQYVMCCFVATGFMAPMTIYHITRSAITSLHKARQVQKSLGLWLFISPGGFF